MIDPFYDKVHLWLTTVELGVVIGKDGRDIPESQVDEYIAGYSQFCSACSLLALTHSQPSRSI